MYLLFEKLFKNYCSVVAALTSLNEGRAFLDISWSQYWKWKSCCLATKFTRRHATKVLFLWVFVKNILCQETAQNAVGIEMHYKCSHTKCCWKCWTAVGRRLNGILMYMNTKYQSKHNHLLYNCYLWATCFDSLESSSGPTKNRSKVI